MRSMEVRMDPLTSLVTALAAARPPPPRKLRRSNSNKAFRSGP